MPFMNTDNVGNLRITQPFYTILIPSVAVSCVRTLRFPSCVVVNELSLNELKLWPGDIHHWSYKSYEVQGGQNDPSALYSNG